MASKPQKPKPKFDNQQLRTKGSPLGGPLHLPLPQVTRKPRAASSKGSLAGRFLVSRAKASKNTGLGERPKRAWFRKA